MTVLHNFVEIDAAPERVWAALAALGALAEYDPAILESTIESHTDAGLGASRRCSLKDGGWFRESVTVWEPCRALAFELRDCSLPVRRLRHRYTLAARGRGTRVEQEMDYQLKYGLLGTLLDTVVVRRRWDQGIKNFFLGLKRHVEAKGTP